MIPIALSITSIQDSRVEVDHDSEGVLLQLSTGDILHIFRQDPGSGGDHVGNTGKLVQRTWDSDTETWGSITDFFNDAYDDRNVHGGVTASGRLVIFFRRYNASTSTTVDNNFMYSDNDGSTWSSRATLTLGDSEASPYGDMIAVPTKGYMMSFQNNYYLEVLFSSDGSTWGDSVVIGDYTSGHEFNLTEAAFAYIGDGKIIGLVRDNLGDEARRMLYQVTSDDYGDTWSVPSRTNISDLLYIVSPRILYKDGVMIVFAPDRRSQSGDGDYSEESMTIMIGDPDEVFSNPFAYRQKLSIARPETSSNARFYGYPTYAPIDDTRFLVVLTDEHSASGTEEASLYQFYLTVKGLTPTVSSVYKIPAFRN